MSSKPRGSRFKLFGLASSTVVPIDECSTEGVPPNEKEAYDGSVNGGGGSPKASQSFDSSSSFDSDVSAQSEHESNCKIF
jgi:hypothetical protein